MFSKVKMSDNANGLLNKSSRSRLRAAVFVLSFANFTEFRSLSLDPSGDRVRAEVHVRSQAKYYS